MDLNAFPDVVLRAVFDRVSLSDLILHIPLVCHRWHSLQPGVLSGKKAIALTVHVGPDDRLIPDIGPRENNHSIRFGSQLTNEDGSRMFPSPADDPRCSLSLKEYHFTPERVDAIIEQFDGNNVTYLDMDFSKQDHDVPTIVIPMLIRLLDHWTGCLKTLKLSRLSSKLANENEENQPETDLMTRLIETVNALPRLEHLTLVLNEDRQMTEPLDLPILGRLKEFYFRYGCGKLDYLFDSLKRYGEPNQQLRAIGLGNVGDMEEYLDNFGESSLAARFTVLDNVGTRVLRSGQIEVPVRERFLNTFTSLTSLSLGMRGLNLAQLTTILAPLHSLVHLELFSAELFSKFDTDPVDDIRQLPSVKVLTLFSDIATHQDLASLHWARMFPNMQFITFMNNSVVNCSLCDLPEKELNFTKLEKEGKSETATSCIRQTLLPFKHAFGRTLKKVYFFRLSMEDKDNCIFIIFTPDMI